MESKWGIIPDMSLTVTLRELVRMDVAKELAMTGRVVRGEEAAELGLVTKCVEDPLQHAIQLAEEIMQRSPDSIAATKRLFQETWHAEKEQHCLDVETELQRHLIPSWNQGAASARNFGVKLPYLGRMDIVKD
jgi:enoyl-CoA hydratase/carnithine racemase